MQDFKNIELNIDNILISTDIIAILLGVIALKNNTKNLFNRIIAAEDTIDIGPVKEFLDEEYIKSLWRYYFKI